MSKNTLGIDLRPLLPGRKLRPGELREAFQRRLWRARKTLRVRFSPVGAGDKTVLCILGCQRSGTTLLTRILDHDPESKIFGEFSRLSSCGKDRIRLNPLDSVAHVLKTVRFPLIVLKPLVESQNAVSLLEQLPNCRVVWLYRRCEDVVASNLRKFGIENGISNLRSALQGSSSWRSESVSERARKLAERNFSEHMSRYDAAALFWYIRNDLFFDLHLNERDDVLPVRYEQLASDPRHVMQRIYGFIGRNYPGVDAIHGVNARSIGKGSDIVLSDEIAGACREMLGRLDAACKSHAGGSVT